MFLAGSSKTQPAVSSMETPGASSKRAWQGLPADLLCHVLQYMDCRERNSCCAQVAQAWHSASVAATTDLHLVCNQWSIPPLGDLLHKNGKCVSSIALGVPTDWSYGPTVTLCLPLQQLAHLHSLSITSSSKLIGYSYYRCVWLQSTKRQHPTCGGAISGRWGDGYSYTSGEEEDYMSYETRQYGQHSKNSDANPFQYVASTLTSLKLHSVVLDGFLGGWGALAASTALQHLDLQLVPDPPGINYNH
jgi:hypothetical protein